MMSTLAAKTITGASDQVQFEFLPNYCMQSKSLKSSQCITDSSIDFPIRFYEINVKTVDPYGRDDDDTCYGKLCIVPSIILLNVFELFFILSFFRPRSHVYFSFFYVSLNCFLVVIVPTCNSRYDENCVAFVEEHHKYHHDKHTGSNADHTHHSKSGKLVNRRDHPKKDYLRLDYLGDLVGNSTTRNEITFLEMTWTFQYPEN